MPWDNNTGGGGRNNSGGPWGQPPAGGGGGGGGPRRGGTPSLEDLLSRGRDQLRGGLPGGSRWVVLDIVVVIVGAWLLQCVYTINPQEVGVELLLGKPKQELSQPGLHFLLWPIETVERVATTENQTEIGSIGSASGRSNEGLMLSADQNIIDVKFSVLWSVTDPAKFLFDVRDPETMVRGAGESAMREVVGRRPADDIFRTAQAAIAASVQQITQSILDSYGVGVRVDQITIQNAAPPAEVADAFDEVQRAEQDEDRFQEEARGDANTVLGQARGQAAQIREDAAAYEDRVVKEAQGEGARFTSIYQQYAKAPDVTRQRLYLETMEQVLGGANKVIADKAASGVVPYLPLPQLNGAAPPAAAGSSTSTSNGPVVAPSIPTTGTGATLTTPSTTTTSGTAGN